MFQNWLKKVYFILKLVLHIMRVQKYGKINLMMKSQMFGQLDVSCMKWLLLDHLFEQKIWKDYIRGLSKGIMNKYQGIILKTLKM